MTGQKWQTIISPYPTGTYQMHRSLNLMHFFHSSYSVPSDTELDRRMWRKRIGTCLQSFITLPLFPKQAKWTETGLAYRPGVYSGRWSWVQIRVDIVQQTKQDLLQAPSDNLICSFESKTELLKISNIKKKQKQRTTLPWSNPNVSILTRLFVQPFICFITSALILEQSWLLSRGVISWKASFPFVLLSNSRNPPPVFPHFVASGLFIPQALNLF